GKGGVGKTNVVANTAVALARLGERVLILDADLGLANMDVICGLAPRWTLEHVVAGRKDLADIVIEGPAGVRILPASRGKQELTALSEGERLHLLAAMDAFDEEFDTMFVDIGAGISSNVCYFAAAAREILIVATPEPTSITDAYALIKVLRQRHEEREFRLVVNCAPDEAAARAVHRNLTSVADRYLDVSIQLLGWVLRDPKVEEAVCLQIPVVEAFPESDAARCFRRLAVDLRASAPSERGKGGVQFFFRRFLTAGPAAEKAAAHA
ncbi:MAG: MinD/ParA family protein, partial [Candidatus Methylomirabilis sp.]|nr:MinD/ParA family protein [Deltaproteobacteria bacterium]